MKTKIVLFLLILAFIFSGTLYAGGNSGQTQAGAVTLRWAMWDAELTVYYKPLIEAYQAKNPNVRIELVDLGSADYEALLGTQLAGGADLDIVTIKNMFSYANLIRQNRLEPLNAFIRSKNINTAQYGGMIEQVTSNGEVFTLPFRNDFWIVYYNKDIFDRAGVPYPTNNMTIEQYDALARRVTSGSGANKIYGAHYHGWRSATQLFSILDGRNSIVGGSYEFLIPYYERILRLQDDGIIMSLAEIRTSGTHYSGAFFNSQIAMMNMGTWFIATQIAQVAKGEAASKNWGIVKYPVPAGVTSGTTFGSFTGLSVNRNSRNKDAALEFIQFVSGSEGAVVLAKTGNFPAIMSQDVISNIVSMPGFPADAASREALNVYRTYLEFPLHDRGAEIDIVLNEAHEAIMLKNISITDGIRQMNDRIRPIITVR
ncbi:MAG: sugar ABC transporter substrate-binding protein [Treponema sp.]|jgi:multiple sugar transport system substrate-binding protein|nr:sugar ABC transporter substrate-binding protein [Treponema sp.]